MNLLVSVKKTIIKRNALLILAMISLLGMSGCTNNHSDRAEIAKNLLEKKYKEDFTIFTSGEGYGSLTGNTFKVVAASTKDKSLKFEATVENEGAYIIDEYVQALLEAKIKNIVSKSMGALKEDFAVTAYVGYAETKSTSVSLEDYTKQNPNVPIVITLVIDKDTVKNVSAEKEYAALSDLFANKLRLNRGALEVYYTTHDIYQKSKKYFYDNAEIYDDFDRMVSNSLKIESGLAERGLTISPNDFIKQRQVE
jgi:hypothetical protein